MHAGTTHLRIGLPAAGLLATVIALAGCGSGSQATGNAATEVTVTNCGKEIAFAAPAEKIFVNDSNMVSMLLALDAGDQIVAVSGINRDKDVLKNAYGDNAVDGLTEAAKEYPSLENVIARKPDVFFAGWNYGFDEEQNLTPAGLAKHDIAAYTLSESCRQDDGEARGTMSAWEALKTDLDNLGKITGRQDSAESLIRDLEDRLDTLEDAPRSDSPTVFLFDSGTKEAMTSGSFGGPQAIIEAAGAHNAAGDLADTWTNLSWERIASAKPDFIAFVDYPGQSFEDKIQVLKHNPATKNLPAVQEERFLNLPYAMWTNGPLNVDAAEHLRKSLEDAQLAPESSIQPQLQLDQFNTTAP